MKAAKTLFDPNYISLKARAPALSSKAGVILRCRLFFGLHWKNGLCLRILGAPSQR
jgi:hypothetical protein